MPIFHRDSTASSSSSRGSVEEPGRQPCHKIFSSQSSQSSASSSGGTHRRRSVLRHTPEDPTIKAAKDQVFRAETAEREADRALVASRRAVKEARDHVKHLEREAAEEYEMPLVSSFTKLAMLMRLLLQGAPSKDQAGPS